MAVVRHCAVGEPMNILLALSTSRYSAHLVERALAEVANTNDAEKVVLHVLYVIERDELSAVSHKVGGEGFLGTSIQQDVLAALQEEHHRMAMLRIEEVQRVAKEKQYTVKVTEASGNFSKEVIDYADKESCDVIFLTRDDRPFISRFLFGSEADRVARLAKKEGLGRVVIDED